MSHKRYLHKRISDLKKVFETHYLFLLIWERPFLLSVLFLVMLWRSYYESSSDMFVISIIILEEIRKRKTIPH